MRKLITALGLLGAMVPGLAGAAEIFDKVGTFDGQFLKIGIGARAEAMGGAFVAVADDASALFWNAAGIARIAPDKSELQFNHAIWPADLKFTQAGYVFHLKKIPGALGVSVRSLYMDPMIETTAYQPDPQVGTGRTFDAGMMAAGLTYARSFTDKFSAGVTLNIVHEGLAELSQQTYAFDLGTLYDVGTAGMRIGMAISNMGTDVQFIDRKARIPSVFRVGTSAMLMQSTGQHLLGSFEFSHPPDNAERLNVGVEYAFHDYLYLRAGDNINYDSEGVAGGVGFHFPVSVAGMADFDYAFTDMKALGAAHRFSLKFIF
ncbi:MAG: PorV/PorQ family protein [Candidatus Eisenbacteria bacterium]|uniref:PorV/PorQ family protein n=1 Tax=Eiseniibacteriota bacterium TaxID=2212470 RepID=A0A9D6L6L3_UNCEI|nr:PorV/PorQ family protein [Candidatus Eisenbacteria bacterium]MBI3539863.1 PorV/PorQ family protein [Candidatus Eisenbacteria bacterium]